MLKSKNSVSDYWPSDQAQNINSSVNRQETINYSSVCHTESTEIVIPCGSEGRIVSTSVAR